MEMKYPSLAETLTQLAQLLPEETDKPAEVIYVEGSLKLSCRPCMSAVMEMSEKFRKGLTLGTKQKRNWGVIGTKLNKKIIEKRYEDDPDQQQFLDLICS